MQQAPGPPGFDWVVRGVDFATLRSDDLALERITAGPTRLTADDSPPYGLTVLVDGGTVYLYGGGSGGQYVARASVASGANGGWEYWTGAAWDGRSGEARPMALDGASPAGPLNVVRWGGGYVGTAKTAGILSDDISAWTSPTPWGPWRPQGRIYTVPAVANTISYGGHLVTGVPGAPFLVYSTNLTNDRTAIRNYGPHFVTATRVPSP
jgi:hypothetical protein